MPSALVKAVPLSLSPLSLAKTVATSPLTTEATKAVLSGVQQAAASSASGFMNRLTRKNQKLTPAQTLAKTRSAMLRLASPQPSQPIAPQPTTTVSRGITANLGKALRGEQNDGPRAYYLPEIQRRAAEQRAALPAPSAPSDVISKLAELRTIRNMPITNAREEGETELQRQMQRSAVLAQAQKALAAELAKLTPAQRAEYNVRNAQRVAAISSTQSPPSSPRASSLPLQSRR